MVSKKFTLSLSLSLSLDSQETDENVKDSELLIAIFISKGTIYLIGRLPIREIALTTNRITQK